MRNTYWFAVDYNGTGHLFTCPPERDTGMWTGEEALYIPKGQFGEMSRTVIEIGRAHV